MIVSAQDAGIWSGSARVIVVGAGIAGVSAAIEALEAGADVMILERSSGCTGTTTTAAGHFYLGGGTAVQIACGFNDSADALIAYLTAVTSEPDMAKIRIFSENCVAHFDWLEAHGVPFDRSYFPSKAVIQPGRECLIWTGNENVWPFRDQATPAPRGHKVAFDGEEGGGALALNRLAEYARRIGGDIHFDTRVDALVVDAGRVVGVRALIFGETQYFRASAGVVLAGGGFGQNPEMMGRLLPRFEKLTMTGGPYDDGTAIRLGVAAGGAAEHMDGVLTTSAIYPPERLVKGILVNRDGQRFVAEDSYHTRTSIEIIDQPDGIAYLIVDADIFAYPDWHEHANQQLVDGFATIAEMEKGLGIGIGALQRTMEAYNREAATGLDPEFGKHPDWLKPLDAGPWAAFDISWGKALFYGFTLGGLRISADGEVLTEGGAAVAGLYAAGACASMLAHDARNYASGISLSAASFFGRQAGRHAALATVCRKQSRHTMPGAS